MEGEREGGVPSALQLCRSVRLPKFDDDIGRAPKVGNLILPEAARKRKNANSALGDLLNPTGKVERQQHESEGGKSGGADGEEAREVDAREDAQAEQVRKDGGCVV